MLNIFKKRVISALLPRDYRVITALLACYSYNVKGKISKLSNHRQLLLIVFNC